MVQHHVLATRKRYCYSSTKIFKRILSSSSFLSSLPLPLFSYSSPLCSSPSQILLNGDALVEATVEAPAVEVAVNGDAADSLVDSVVKTVESVIASTTDAVETS